MSRIPNTTNLNVGVDVTIKQKSVKASSIPFKIKESKPSKELKKALKEVDYMMKHPEKYKVYNNVDELFEDLNKD